MTKTIEQCDPIDLGTPITVDLEKVWTETYNEDDAAADLRLSVADALRLGRIPYDPDADDPAQSGALGAVTPQAAFIPKELENVDGGPGEWGPGYPDDNTRSTLNGILFGTPGVSGSYVRVIRKGGQIYICGFNGTNGNPTVVPMILYNDFAILPPYGFQFRSGNEFQAGYGMSVEAPIETFGAIVFATGGNANNFPVVWNAPIQLGRMYNPGPVPSDGHPGIWDTNGLPMIGRYQGPSIDDPTGGVVTDTECRAALISLLEFLRGNVTDFEDWGLIAKP